MNIRAIALGAAVGFVIAVAPSCGGNKCSPANCGGCCDTAGKCVQKANSGNNTTCGNQGVACVDCSKTTGQVCANFVCTGGTAGGAGGGVAGGTGGAGGGTGGGTACDGCRLPSGTCVPLANTTVNNCGTGGAQCNACQTGQLCTLGVCTTPTVTKKVGDPCAATADCAALGATAMCKLVTSTGNATYTAGYCTLPCGSAGQTCPTGSNCVSLPAQYGEADAFCWDLCGTGDACRSPGYACYRLTSSAGQFTACWLDPVPSVDAGPPADKVGEPCTADTACQNPPDPGQGGACIPEICNSTFSGCPQDAGTPPTGHTGGYCTRGGCDYHSQCSADGGAICLSINSAGDTQCFRHCLDGGAGQSDCRTGYICQQFTRTLADGGREQSADGYCDPNCNNLAGYCGNYADGGAVVCSALGYCQF